MVEQRVPTEDRDRSASRRVWLPEGWTEAVEPRPSDWYVVVDELMDGTAVLAYARWPRLDAVGRLSFGKKGTDARHAISIPEDRLQTIVDDARRESSPEDDPAVVERPLRVGDAFLVRRIEGGDQPVVDVAADVTTYARTAAKKALYAAVAPRVSPQEAQALRLASDEGDEMLPPEPPPAGPSNAAPAV